MKSFKYLFIILVIFFKTGNVLSVENLFTVNNIEVQNQKNADFENLADQAIKKAFLQLIDRILLEKDKNKLKSLKTSQVKDLVSYYQIKKDGDIEKNIKTFNIFFDKYKFHDLFYENGISYSDTSKNELFLLPVLKKNNQYFVYNKNFFYENWIEISQNELIEFILPLENIETLQKINSNKNDLLGLDLTEIFQEFTNKNFAFIFVDDDDPNEQKIFMKLNIVGKKISKSLSIKKTNSDRELYYKDTIKVINKELENFFKSQNLIDIRTPSFINAKFKLTKNNNLMELNKRLKKIDLVQNIYIQQFNKNYINLRIKYLGKIDKIIALLKNQNIFLEFENEEWNLKIV